MYKIKSISTSMGIPHNDLISLRHSFAIELIYFISYFTSTLASRIGSNEYFAKLFVINIVLSIILAYFIFNLVVTSSSDLCIDYIFYTSMLRLIEESNTPFV